MKGEIPDWVRLQKALSIEAEKGYPDLQGINTVLASFCVLVLGIILPWELPPVREIAGEN